MAENNFIKHAFVSPKSDGPDSTLVRPSNWNDGLVFAGGINGQVLVYDNTQDNNMRWTDGRYAAYNQLVISTSTPTPIINAASITRVFNSTNIFTLTAQISTLTTVGAASAVVTTYTDGTPLNGVVVSSGTGLVTLIGISTLPAGSHTVSIGITTTGGVNILTCSIGLLFEFSGI